MGQAGVAPPPTPPHCGGEGLLGAADAAPLGGGADSPLARSPPLHRSGEGVGGWGPTPTKKSAARPLQDERRWPSWCHLIRRCPLASASSAIVTGGHRHRSSRKSCARGNHPKPHHRVAPTHGSLQGNLGGSWLAPKSAAFSIPQRPDRINQAHWPVNWTGRFCRNAITPSR